ncbi:unnamed protein product [Arabidopsis lyrata]|uniref:CHCH domain-containing protein n=2 Tax=Arabidopsis lyrata subsp. lyrata TaxID=81972 RepID=D7M915_ARALL|nr:hypothetical protein ARALYDRAFT_329281 [Arabidopsis lyrata subsp. lyrata]CAH8275576.1 unnamed protein product [Arabidopsis lyrata]
MEKQSPKPVCGQEALQLLNCVTESSFDQEKCLRFLQSLRECVLSKKVNKFSIPSQDQDSEGAASATTRPS